MALLSRVLHRVRQFAGALRPRVTARDRTDAYAYLSAPERNVFESMTLRDQEHGIAVMRRVRDECGDADHALIVAALLHDCGKQHVTLWHRVLHVAIPDVIERHIAAESGASWRRALWRLFEHPRLGAEMVAAAGSGPEVVRLIAEQEADADPADGRLVVLQRADDG
jgi:hypothetical protein